MASQPKIEIQISAKADQLSAGLAKARREIAGLPAVADQTERRLSGLGSRAGASMFGLDRVEKQIGRLTGAARVGAGGFAGGLRFASSTIPGLGLVAGAASVAGIGEMTSRLSSAGVELTNTSRLAGTTAAGLNSMRGAARLMGLSAETADGAMLGLNHTIQDAVYGRNAEALNYFKLAGVEIGSIATGAKSADSILPKLVDTLTEAAKKNPLAAERLAQIWGIPAGALPMLIRGKEALQANRQEVERIYGSFDKYQESSERFTFATGRLSLASEKLGMTVMTSLEPHLSPLLLSLSTWVEKHDKDVGQAFDGIGRAITGVNWKAVGQDVDYYIGKLTKLVSSAEDVANRVGRVQSTLGGIRDVITAPGRAFSDWAEPQLNQLVADADGRIMPVGDPRAIEINNRRRAYDYASPRERAGANTSPVGSSLRQSESTNSSTKQAFVARWWPEAVRISGRVGTSPENILAHWAQETGWGSHEHDNNVGNLQAARAGPDTVTRGDTHADGSRYSAPFFRYNSTTEAADAYASWVERHGAAGAGGSPVDYGNRLRSAHYMENPNAPADIARTRADLDRMRSSPTAGRPALPLPTPPAVTPQNSTVRIVVEHNNAPADVSMRPSVSGSGAELGEIRVRRAMPEAGSMMPAFGGT